MAGRIEFNPIRVRTHYLHTIMKLELENKRQVEEDPPHSATADWLGTQSSETQDFQEFMAENETAVLHLQTAEELERLKAEEDSSRGSSLDSLGVCLLEEPLCPSLARATPLLIQAQLPPGASVLCFADSSSSSSAEGDQPYLNSGPVVYYQVGPERSVPGVKQETSMEPDVASLYSVPVTSLVPCTGATAASRTDPGKTALDREALHSESCPSEAPTPSLLLPQKSLQPQSLEQSPESASKLPSSEDRSLGSALAL